MKLVTDLSLTSRFARRAPPWYAQYAAMPGRVMPAMVADFETDRWHQGGPLDFARASVASHVDATGALRLVAAGEPRFDSASGRRGLLIERAATNKATNANANPADTAGLTPGSGATVGVVDDAEALAAAGLAAICSSGRVYRCVFPAASAFVSLPGTTGNTNPHQMSVYLRVESGGGVHVRAAGAGSSGASAYAAPAGYTRITAAHLPGGASNFVRLYADAATTFRFVLNELVEAEAPGTPIVTQGAAATRAIERAAIPLGPWWNPAEGTLVVEGRWLGPATGAAWIVAAQDGTSQRTIGLSRTASGEMAALVRTPGSSAGAVLAGSAGFGQFRAALAYRADDIAACFGGGAVWSASGGAVPVGLTGLALGAEHPAAPVAPGLLVNRVIYYDRRLPAAALQYVTA